MTIVGAATDHITISSITITPNPPVKGGNFTVVAAGTLDEQITGGNITLTVKYDKFITVLKQTDDLCADGGCPISAGSFTKTISQALPSAAPAGSYSVHVTANDQNNEELACVNVALTIASKSN
eukprot:TRINITY_DN3239_c0_g1_i3.p1 TRINITY_DN3239_c0_g1~~TRINITY_DN3239_c0_g1_i3.p1  ORF type:complete len:124 (+),score=52.24 TRINITY_DN3239_c0_g1_i3:314-685(+)